MSETHEAVGSCLCGAVDVSAKNMSDNVGACHCSACRKWSGGPFLGVYCGSDVRIKGEEHVSVYDSSEWAERGFCTKCGSHLFYRLKHDGSHVVPVGLFGDEHPFTFDHQIFVDERPAYYSFAQRTSEMTGQEAFDKYAPETAGD